jgi:hypothetical protein
MGMSLFGFAVLLAPPDPLPGWPWLIAVVSALLFGFLGKRARRGVLPWAFGGGVISLAACTFAWGLANAGTVPYTEEMRSHRQFSAMVAMVLLIAIVGILVALVSGAFMSKPQGQATGLGASREQGVAAKTDAVAAPK